MLRLVTRLFRTKRDSPSLPLGRWNTISIPEEENRDILVKNAIEKNAYWGNHDHCGSEICKTPVEFETIPKQKQTKYNQKDLMFYQNHPHWPFIL